MVMYHKCPGPGCTRQVPLDQLACRRHWFQVPVELRLAVWRAWRQGAGAGSAEHATAMDAAIATMRR